MSKKKNPELKQNDRIILVYMPDEYIDTGTKGRVTGIAQAPTLGGSPNYIYNVEWLDDDGKVISTLSILPNVDSWILDPEFTQNDLNEAKNRVITDLDELISRHEWSRLFKKSDLKYIMEYLEAIRQSGIVNMFQSGQFLGQTKDYLKGYFNLHRMQRDLDEDDEKIIEKIMEMSDNVRNIMISAAVSDLEQNNKEITGRSATNKINRLSTELVKHFMGR